MHIPRIFAEIDREQILPLAALLVCAGAAAALAAALAFEHIGGYAPCPLCVKQRWAYYAAVPLAAGGGLLALYERRDPAVLALAICAAAFAVNAVFGVYHAGIEWGWWAGPADCAGGDLAAPGGNLMEELNATPITPCDEAPWRFLGLSFAGYSALLSAGLAIVAFTGATVDAAQRRAK